ncbi:SGNH/GDSL hydrolase family protein [Actinomadura sp. KC06]|uniref:SGNH/GDSL hydrolase family protein n=1 Tax=Actinomadura sp. KC06 TaxID=2530369 RepID=UPI00104D160C|nr:SGNH/GDSL hydrolase family protein [Actinomadura sp. KC06]TDD34958.1 SGNH/GDSL hydrolase family protein [Actinomadura sp. KC06]
MDEQTDEYALPTETAAQLLAGAPWRRMVTIGDSVAAGIHEAVPGYRDLSWSERIEDVLATVNPGFQALNLGVRDLVTAEVRATQLAPALEFEPDLAFVMCGGNDMLRPGFDPAAVKAELAAMVSALRKAGADVVTFGMLDITQAGLVPAEYEAYISRNTRVLAELTRELSKELGAIYVHFTDHPLSTDKGIYSSDRLHLNARGQAFAAAEKMRALARHLTGSQWAVSPI